MNGHERMLSLVDRVYGAAADPARWPSALEQLADECRGSVAGFLCRTTESVVRSATFVRLDPPLAQALLGDYAARNPWRPFDRPWFRPGSVIVTEQLLPVADLQRTEFYDGILRPAQLAHASSACVWRRGNEGATFTALRSARRGPFQPVELKRIRAVVPHLQRALQINNRLSQLERTRGALAEGLERLTHGVLLVDRRGRVTFANQAARAIVSQHDGLSIHADGLSATSRTDRLKLRSLIDQAVRTAAGAGFDSGGAMTISRPSLKRPFRLLIAPLRLELDPQSPSGLATVFVSDPEEPAEATAAMLAEAHGLTPAEARLAAALVSAGGLRRAVRHLSISHETARWHLKHIYKKTGADHQSALLRVIEEVTGRLKLDPGPRPNPAP